MKHNVTRNDRLASLLSEQSKVRRSRIRRRNTGLAAAMVLLVGGVVWMVSPSRQAVPPQPSQRQALTNTTSVPEPDQTSPPQSDDTAFRITRVSDRPLKLTTIVQSSEPQRVEFISDLQLMMTMRGQGIDAGLVRTGGQTQLAFNDEESRRRFEERSGSAE